MKTIVHILNLDTAGGVEHLFAHYLEQETKLHHVVSITGRKPHQHFDLALQHAQKVVYERYLLGLKIPKILHPLSVWKRNKAIDQISSPNILFWNRMESDFVLTNPKSTVTYYEHGAAWMGSVTESKQRFLSSANSIIAISRAAKEMLKQRWSVHCPITVIPNPRRPDIPIALTHRILPSQRPFRLGYIGRLTPLKGVPIAIHILHELTMRGIDVELVIAGVGDDAETCTRLTETLELKGKIARLKFVNNVVDWYDSIDLLLVPSIREPLGLIAIEAAARGLPVLASNVDGLPEVIEDQISGILVQPTLPIESYYELGGQKKNLPEFVFDPESSTVSSPKIIDPHRSADLIEKLLSDKDHYEQLSKGALITANLHPTFTNYTKALTHALI